MAENMSFQNCTSILPIISDKDRLRRANWPKLLTHHQRGRIKLDIFKKFLIIIENKTLSNKLGANCYR